MLTSVQRRNRKRLMQRLTLMQLLSVNIGQARSIQNGKQTETTGIYKEPRSGPVFVTALGVTGDAICDVENHGGADQAIYVYGAPDYAWWSAELGWEVEPGTFGDNLTIAGLESARLNIGDMLHVGAVTLQVTAPRIPCSTLAARMGDPTFVKRFRAAERPGLYCRVLCEGTIQAGDPVRLEPYTGATIPAIELFRTYFIPDLDEATLRRHLAAPLAVRARADTEEKLRKVRTYPT